MPNELQDVKKAELLSNLPPNAMAQIGNSNTQIAHANTVNNITTFVIPPVQANAGATGGVVTLCRDCYNLFVVGDESFTDMVGHFTVPKDRALTESMTEDLKAQFSTLQGDAIAKIMTFPSIFACKNKDYGKTDAAHQAYYGMVLNVEPQDNGIKITYRWLSSFPQQRLNEIAASIGIEYASSFNELDKTHWAIKELDLIEALRMANISVLAPT